MGIELTPSGLDHRAAVGGLWGPIGVRQFDFLRERGLHPGDVLLDLGCGSLRGGVHFIRYLEAGHYLGLEKQFWLVEAGIDHELGPATLDEKAPEFVISDKFEFFRFQDSRLRFCSIRVHAFRRIRNQRVFGQP